MENMEYEDFDIDAVPAEEDGLDEPGDTDTAVEMQLLLARVQAARFSGA